MPEPLKKKKFAPARTKGKITGVYSTEHRIVKIKALRKRFRDGKFPGYAVFVRECIWLDFNNADSQFLWNQFRKEIRGYIKARKKAQKQAKKKDRENAKLRGNRKDKIRKEK